MPEKKKIQVRPILCDPSTRTSSCANGLDLHSLSSGCPCFTGGLHATAKLGLGVGSDPSPMQGKKIKRGKDVIPACGKALSGL